MTTAQKAMLDFIDSGGTDLQVRYALLEELDASMANFNEKLAEFLKLWKT